MIKIVLMLVEKIAQEILRILRNDDDDSGGCRLDGDRLLN